MRSRNIRAAVAAVLCLAALPIQNALAHSSGEPGPNFVQIKAATPKERTRLTTLGVSIEAVRSDSIYGTVTDKTLAKLRRTKNVKILETFRLNEKSRTLDFPEEDARFHNYDELTKGLDDLAKKHEKLMKVFSIGKSLEGREIWCVQINTSEEARNANSVTTFSAKPGIVFMGNHHAREHVSAEIPYMLIEYLLDNYGKVAEITDLIDKRDIYIIPMVNPDGVEYDISDADKPGNGGGGDWFPFPIPGLPGGGDDDSGTRNYKAHRKNMRKNKDGGLGVDLNRNYGYKWKKGAEGASDEPDSETYRGPEEFSEPETQAVRDFVKGHPNLKILLTYHTFSELILYPWGYTHKSIEEKQDLEAFKTMATKMAGWNGYKPEQSSDLYIANGDTTDWAYGELKIFAFTFELSPKDGSSLFDPSAGFYPKATLVDKIFEDNLKPALYLIDLADDPYRSLQAKDDQLLWLDSSSLPRL